jgi:hypothetical protein
MADEPTSLILEQLRLIRADAADIKHDLGEQRQILDRQTATLSEHTRTLDGLLSIAASMDSRLFRVEKHFGLVEA